MGSNTVWFYTCTGMAPWCVINICAGIMCREALAARSSRIVPTEYAVQMIETVLDHNDFDLGDKHYKQKEGIAIGSRLGKNFACSYMRKWDELLYKYHIHPLFYKRFIDDGFGVWVEGLDSLKDFAQFANSIHPNIKIEFRWSEDKIEFLDTYVIKDKGHIYTTLYKKPTDKQLYLRKDSCHPAHTKKALAYGLALRLKRICKKERDYKEHRCALKKQLRKRGYSSREIEHQFNRVDNMNRNELLQVSKIKTESDRVPLVTTYSRRLPDIANILRKHHRTLLLSDHMKHMFKEPPMVSYRRDRNLCDVLVHRKTYNAIKSPAPVCSCKICTKVKRDVVYDTNGDTKYQPVINANCCDRNVIYGRYVSSVARLCMWGKLKETVKERVTEHLRTVRMQEEKPIIRHFRGHGEIDVGVVVLQRMGNRQRLERLIVEECWINKLGT